MADLSYTPTHLNNPCSKSRDCGVAKTLKIIGSKWTILLLHNLFDGKKRFGELQRSLDGISPKTLAQRLKELEKDGIIKRKVFTEIPLHVEYTLTQRGKSLEQIFTQMAEWGGEKV
jgi:DNA-binding HxlR family transcriptional regulator